MGSNKFNKVSGETEMRIETDRLVIRDLEQKDKEQLFKIVWQKEVIRFMRDWSEHIPSAESLTGYVDWHQTQKESTDMLIGIKHKKNLQICMSVKDMPLR